MIYILDQRKDNTKHNATGKAMTDVFEIMKSLNVKTVKGMPKDASKVLKILDLFILAWYCIFIFGKKDYCIFVFSDNPIKIKMLKALKFIRRYKVICLINDVNSIRSDGLYSEERKDEIDRDFKLIGSADIILAPNKGSIEYMQNRGIKSKMIPVGVWDYLMDEKMGAKCDELSTGNHSVNLSKWRIGFAGNLGKSDFLDGLANVYDEVVEYHLWGDLEDRKLINNNVIYGGSVSPNVLPFEIAEKCDFGLVWDGTSATSIEGGYGEYLRFNNSHKCGCYLAAGVPVFVWKDSGMAHFVSENGCGYLIESLSDIPKILADTTLEEQEEMMKSVGMVAEKIRAGYYLESALKTALD